VTHPCSTCPRPATLTITGRIPGRTCYSALTCDQCAPKHRQKAYETGGPIQEEPLEDRAQDALF
jgi:protein-arginine kinase activator protein McsA